MINKIVVLGIAATLTVSGPALAGGGPHGGGGGGGARGGMAVGAQGGHDFGASMRDQARVNRQGPLNASDRARERANANAGLNDSGAAASVRAHGKTDLNHGRVRRDTARANRQGPSHASARAHERANVNAGLDQQQ